MRAALVAVIAFALLFSGGKAQALRHPGAPKCTVFPASSPWNQRVDTLPVARELRPRSSRSIGVDDHCTPTSAPASGTAGRSASRSRSSASTAKVARLVRLRRRERQGPVPDPDERRDRGRPRSPTATGTRSSSTATRCKLYELFALYPTAGGGWRAGSGAIWTSARTAPPGRLDVRRRGRPADPPRARALRRGRARADRPRAALHGRRTRRAYVWPARHFASDVTDPTCRRWGCASG